VTVVPEPEDVSLAPEEFDPAELPELLPELLDPDDEPLLLPDDVDWPESGSTYCWSPAEEPLSASATAGTGAAAAMVSPMIAAERRTA
jgi:hypothetical protein